MKDKTKHGLAALEPRRCALGLGLLTALTLMHCGNDEGRSASPDSPTAPPAGPLPIYFWPTACVLWLEIWLLLAAPNAS